jgi:hypothetical protein
MPVIEALPASKKKRARTLSAKSAVHIEAEAPLAVTAIQWYYFFRACTYFFLGSILLSYPSSAAAAWLIAHSRILVPFTIHATEAAPLINVVAETFFVFSIASAILGVLWLMRSSLVRWITLCYAGILLTRTVLYFVTFNGLVPRTVLTTNQTAVLLTGAVVNLLIFGYVAFFPGVDEESAPAS